MVLCLSEMGHNSGGFGIGIETEAAGGSPRSLLTGTKRNRNFGSLRARDENVLEIVRKGESFTLGQWTDLFLENYSKPPVRTSKTHSANLHAAKHLKSAFATCSLTDISADNVELYLRERLRQPARFKTSVGYHERGRLKPSTVHQELGSSDASSMLRCERGCSLQIPARASNFPWQSKGCSDRIT